jgi:hypothetical protein
MHCNLTARSVEGSVRGRHWDQVRRGGGDRKTLAQHHRAQECSVSVTTLKVRKWRIGDIPAA